MASDNQTPTTKPAKTWKREFSLLMLAHLIVLTYWGSESLGALNILALPYIVFMTTAFGLDTVAKQTNLLSKDPSK